MSMSTDTRVEPAPEALEHSARVAALIEEQIAAAGGHIGFERFMQLALYAPGLGYYSAGAAKLGESGDFITAAEQSRLYAECLAEQCAEVLSTLRGGSVLELGAGSGTLAAGILAILERADRLPERYLILEVSADLRARQRETIARRAPHLAARVKWLDRLPERPLPGVLLASEVLDALPVALFRIAASAAERRIESLDVVSAHPGFALRAFPADAALARTVAEIERDLQEPLPIGFASECRPMLGDWMVAVARALEQGFVLIVDYGLPRREYYAVERNGGTLLCHYRHRAHADPFFLPGLQDIGAWVDFTAVMRAAATAGLELAGFTTQLHYLLGCGLMRHFEAARTADPARAADLTREMQLLTLPGQMGERFRVLALARSYPLPLRTMTAARDLTRTL
jgi:SAM-dependent MidA family methyltransferase